MTNLLPCHITLDLDSYFETLSVDEYKRNYFLLFLEGTIMQDTAIEMAVLDLLIS